MKNTLELWIERNRKNEVKVMNDLQMNGGPISDLCVMACDVAEVDAVRAVKWLKNEEELL